jgi:YVTN family beta-propeller protein
MSHGRRSAIVIGMRRLLLPYLAALAVVLGACGIDGAELPATPSPSPEVTEALPSVAPGTPAPPLHQATIASYSKLRVFVASENTEQVWVLEAAPGSPFAVVGKIPVGKLPHQMAVSPDGKWVAVNNRLSASTSIIDPLTMKEVARLKVGNSPHGITFSPDSQTLFVAHERANYIARFEVGSWKPLPPLFVGVPQHVLTIGSERPTQLLFTVTNSTEADHLRSYDLATGQITKFKVQDVHDAYYTPDQSEIWSSSSGFIGKPSDRMVIYDPDRKTVKEEIHLGPGRYPFHTEKANQDGMYFLPDRSIMLLSDHSGPALLWVDYRARKIVGETKGIGHQPFHTTYDPEGSRLLLTTNVDGMVNIIDVNTRLVVQKVGVPTPHGIASVGIP